MGASLNPLGHTSAIYGRNMSPRASLRQMDNYFAPYHADKVLCVVPEEGSVYTIGHSMDDHSLYFAPGILANNGHIYFAPARAAQVLQINTEAETVQLIG